MITNDLISRKKRRKTVESSIFSCSLLDWIVLFSVQKETNTQSALKIINDFPANIDTFLSLFASSSKCHPLHYKFFIKNLVRNLLLLLIQHHHPSFTTRSLNYSTSFFLANHLILQRQQETGTKQSSQKTSSAGFSRAVSRCVASNNKSINRRARLNLAFLKSIRIIHHQLLLPFLLFLHFLQS